MYISLAYIRAGMESSASGQCVECKRKRRVRSTIPYIFSMSYGKCAYLYRDTSIFFGSL